MCLNVKGLLTAGETGPDGRLGTEESDFDLREGKGYMRSIACH